jgi:TRAP-type C4-dicarboxylate transport system permease small subunit
LKSVTKFFDAVYWFFMTSCKICFIAMVFITAAVVFNRYVLKMPMTWGEPVVLMCMVYMSLVSAALAIRKDTHIRMQVIEFLVPPQVVAAMRILAQIGIFAFGVFMLYYGWEFMFRVARRNIMTGVGIRSTWLYLANPVAGFAICLMEIERAINFFDRLRKGKMLRTATMEEEAREFVKDAAGQLDGEAE